MESTGQVEPRGGGLGFNELLLGAVIVLMLVGAWLGTALYVLPSERLEIPGVQPAVRVAQDADFPVGASRLVRWGERAILVVRPTMHQYIAVEGASPSDGCILQWEAAAERIVSPCTYVVYDLDGSAVAGLATAPLRRYPVFIRDGTVYVGGA